MRRRTPFKTVNLDRLVSGKLPDEVVKAINKLELTIGQLEQWDASKPALQIMAIGGHLSVEIRMRVSIKKLFLFVGGVGGLVWTVSSLIIEYLPRIQALLDQYNK